MLARLIQFAFVMALLATAPTDGGPLLELKTPRGIDFTLQNSPTPQKYLIEAMPGGMAYSTTTMMAYSTSSW